MNHTLTGADVQLDIAGRIEVHRVDGASEVDRLASLLDLRRAVGVLRLHIVHYPLGDALQDLLPAANTALKQ